VFEISKNKNKFFLINFIQVFKEQSDVAMKILGTLTNLAEFSDLKKHLMKSEIISLLR
jgi:hypothetical protein